MLSPELIGQSFELGGFGRSSGGYGAGGELTLQLFSALERVPPVCHPVGELSRDVCDRFRNFPGATETGQRLVQPLGFAQCDASVVEVRYEPHLPFAVGRVPGYQLIAYFDAFGMSCDRRDKVGLARLQFT